MIAFEHGVRRKLLLGQFLWFALWVAITVTALFLHPDPSGHGTHTQLGLPPCPSVLVMGRPCPGCGLTTSWTATVHGDLGAAWRANPLGSLLYFGFTVSAFLSLYGFVRRARLDLSGKRFNQLAVALLVGYLAFGAYRFVTARDYSVGPMVVRGR
ncbi:MAG: DUF2752 domain-containing protein [Fimbriimonadaceae bacterium]|nr:DUF2752 domain-containing protein [Fimbriimonadaceae bacterium]